MLHLFNRAALITCFDRERCAQIQAVLHQNNIETHIKAVNQFYPRNTHNGFVTPLFRNPNTGWQYTLYVPRKDLELARHLAGVGGGW